MTITAADRTRGLTPSGIRAVHARALELERAGERVLHFELGRPDFDTPGYIKRAAIERLQAGDVFYTPNRGILELREAIARDLTHRKGVPADAAHVIVTAGASEGVLDTLLALVNPGDEVLVPDPGWVNYASVTRFAGGVPVGYALRDERGFMPDPEELERLVTPRTKAIVLINPGNPTGAVLDEGTLVGIADIARGHDLAVIADEIYERFTYDGARHVSMASLPGMAERTVTLGGFSKAYSMTGWRVGWVLAPDALLGPIATIHQQNSNCAASFSQYACVVALEGERGEVERMVEAYRERRDAVVAGLAGVPGISCVVPAGAFYAFANIAGVADDDTAFARELLEREHVAVVPGRVFGPTGAGHIRISFASSLADVREGMDRLARFARAHGA